MAPAAVARASAPCRSDAALRQVVRDCPVLEPEPRRLYKEALKAAADYSLAFRAFLGERDAKAQGAWLKASTAPHKTLFQPWSLEILFLTAVRETIRFSELESLLGVSSRTLSTKLRALTEEGFLERIVYDEQPVRIEYRCTKHGRATAALATPLFTHLNLHTVSGGR